MAALHKPETIDSMVGKLYSPKFDAKNDMHCLKIASYLFTTCMNYPPSTNWLKNAVCTHKDWIEKATTLMASTYFPPLIVHLGPSIGWCVMYWKGRKLRMKTAMSVTVRCPSMSKLLICMILWARVRVKEGTTNANIATENGKLTERLDDIASCHRGDANYEAA